MGCKLDKEQTEVEKVKEYLELHAARELLVWSCCVNNVDLIDGAKGPQEYCALSVFAGLPCTCIQIQILTKIMVNKVHKKHHKKTAYGIYVLQT